MAVYQVKQSTTAYPLVFFMTDSSDHVTGKTGLSPTVTVSKAGASFGSPSGAVSEIANGWYKVAGNATDSGTLGALALHATATGADPADCVFEVVAFDPQDAVKLGLTRVVANVDQFGGVAGAFSGGRPEVNVTYENGTAIKRVYIYWASSDTASGTALKTAVEAAAKGTTIFVGPGVYYIGDNSMTVPDGVRLCASGIDITTIYTDGEGQCPLQLGAGSLAQDLTAKSTNDLTAPAFNALGTLAAPCVLNRVRLFGQVDGLYQDAPTARSAKFFNCIVECPLDCVTLFGVAHYFELDNCLINSGPSSDSNARGLNLQSSAHVQARNCTFVAHATTAVGLDYAISARETSIVELEECSIVLIGSPSKVKAFEIAAGATVRCTNCEFDRSLVTGSLSLDVFSPLRGTTMGNTLDVTATGGAGIDWANVENGTTAHNLSGTTISSSQVAASVTGNVGGNVVGSVASVTNAVTIGTNNDKTGYGLADGAITAAKIAASALNSKGDWLLSSGYQPPDNDGIAAAAASAATAATAATNALGQATSAATSAASADTQATAIKAKTDNLPTDPASNTQVNTRLAASSYTAPPSASTVANAVAAQTSVAAGLSTIGTNLDAKVSDIVAGSGGTVIPVNQVPVSENRTIRLVVTSNGLAGEVPLFCTIGDNQTYAFDFGVSLAANGRLVSLDSITVTSGPTNGLTISDADEDQGVDRGQAKFKAHAVTAGTYTIHCGVTYSDHDGSGTAQGTGVLRVRPV
jgi:hypothetical protein